VTSRRGRWLPPLWLIATWVVSRLLLFHGLDHYIGTDGMMGLALKWAEALRTGHSPYHVVAIAYPPAAMFTFLLPAIGSPSLDTFNRTYPLMILAVDLIGFGLAWAAERTGRRHATLAYVFLVPLVGPLLLLWRYDLLPAVASLAAVVFALRDRRAASWACLAVGVALKPYVLVLAPVWVLWECVEREARPRRLARCLALLCAPSLLALAAMAPIAGIDSARAYSFQATRGLTVDSTAAIGVAELGRHGVDQTAVLGQECQCLERAGRAAGPAKTASILLLVVALAAVYVLVWRARVTAVALAVASAASVVVLVLLYPVFSPQYLTWTLPVVVLVGERRGQIALAGCVAASLVAFYEYPSHWVAVAAYDGLIRWVLLGRVAALTAAAVALIGGLARLHRPNICSLSRAGVEAG